MSRGTSMAIADACMSAPSTPSARPNSSETGPSDTVGSRRSLTCTAS